MNTKILRIIEGWFKYFKSLFFKETIPAYAEARLKVCNKCPFKKAGFCTVCGCAVNAKTKVLEEYCPKNKWSDIKYHADSDTAMVNLNEDKGVLLSTDRGYSFAYNPLNFKDLSGASLTVINQGSNDITDLSVSVCSCVSHNKIPKTLKAGDNFEFKFSYNTELVGSFNKPVKFKTGDNVVFVLNVMGNVNK